MTNDNILELLHGNSSEPKQPAKPEGVSLKLYGAITSYHIVQTKRIILFTRTTSGHASKPVQSHVDCCDLIDMIESLLNLDFV